MRGEDGAEALGEKYDVGHSRIYETAGKLPLRRAMRDRDRFLQRLDFPKRDMRKIEPDHLVSVCGVIRPKTLKQRLFAGKPGSGKTDGNPCLSCNQSPLF